MFSIYHKDLTNLAKWYLSASPKFARAAGNYLNRAAFGSRELALTRMRESFTIRSPKFVQRQLRVQKSPTSGDWTTMVAYFGSLAAPRFTGWAEQEEQAEDRREKLLRKAARDGSYQNIVRAAWRMKPGASFDTPTAYPGRSAAQRAVIMLKHLQRTKYRRPFRLFGHPRLPVGLYRYEGHGLPTLLQGFGKAPADAKHVHWMRDSVNKYFERDHGRAWSDVAHDIVMRGMR